MTGASGLVLSRTQPDANGAASVVQPHQTKHATIDGFRLVKTTIVK